MASGPPSGATVIATDDCTMPEDISSTPPPAAPNGDSARVRASLSLELQIPDKATTPAPAWMRRAGQSIQYCREHFTRHLVRLHDLSPSTWYKRDFMLHPLSRFRCFWDTTLAFAVIYECWLIPFTLAMSWWTPSHSVEGLHISLDIFFIVDLVLNFRTAVVVYGELVHEPRDVALIYFKSWFLVDFVSVFPTDVVVAALATANSVSSTSTRGVKMLKYVKLPKLLRLSQLVRRFRRFQRYEGSLTIFCAFVFTLHIAGCIWIAAVGPCDEPMSKELASGFCSPSSVFDVYALGLYYAVMMMTSMSLDVVFASDNPLCGGFRELVNGTAASSVERPLPSTLLNLSTAFAIVGVILNSVVIGSSVFVVESWNRAGYQFRKRIDTINHEMEFLQLPEYLRLRIKAYHQYLWTHQGSATEKVTLLQDKGMSEPLRKEIAVFMYRDMLAKVPLFESVSDQLLGFVCLCLTTVIFLPQDKIITRGEVGKDLFIVARGCVVVLAGDVLMDATLAKLAPTQSSLRHGTPAKRPSTTPNSKVLSSSPVMAKSSDDSDDAHGDIILMEGSFFGEMGLLMEVERTRTVVAGSICELGVLSKKDFTVVMKQFPSFAKEIKRLVADRSKDPLTRPDSPTSSSSRRSMTRAKLTPLKGLATESTTSESALRRRPTLARRANASSSSSRPPMLSRQKSLSAASLHLEFPASYAAKDDIVRLDAKLDRVERLLQDLLARSDAG